MSEFDTCDKKKEVAPLFPHHASSRQVDSSHARAGWVPAADSSLLTTLDWLIEPIPFRSMAKEIQTGTNVQDGRESFIRWTEINKCQWLSAESPQVNQ